MTASRSRLARLFDEALDCTPDERVAFVRQACAGDAALEAELLALLAVDDSSPGPLDTPLSVLAGPLLADAGEPGREALPPGTRVGPYAIVRPIGRGGMGTVHLAERADGAYRQQVALKVVNAGLHTAELERRFLHERQILARLDHPGIARLLDGGLTDRGDPYLVLQLVEGTPITAWADARDLAVPARLRLFLQVCEAVRYAHRRLVIHRDLKPSNILVTESGEVRLLDFGIARLLSTEDDAESTRTGLLLLTPEYAAPEQLRGEPASVASDVYALGVVLYELLAGARPFPGRLADRLRNIESDAPVASATAPPGRADALRGDLDAVLGHALRADPERRYVSVDALADDVRRHLEHRPVRARPDSAFYRAGRFARRHRFGVAATVALGLSVLGGLVTALVLATAARREEARSEAVRGFLFSLWEGTDPDRNLGVMPTARDLLDRGAERIDSLSTPDVRVDMLNTLGFLYLKLGEYDRAAGIFEDAVAEARLAFGIDERTGTALDGLAQSLIATGDAVAAEGAAREGLEIRTAARVADSTLAAGWSTLGGALSAQSRHAEALDAHRAALALDRRAYGPRSLAVAVDRNNLGLVARADGDYESAERDLREALAIRRDLLGGRHPLVALSLGSLAALLRTLGHLDEAEAMQREALDIRRTVLGPEHPDVAISLDQIALTVAADGRLDEADSLTVEALGLRERTLGPHHPETLAAMNNLATVRFRRGRFAWAAEMQERVLDAWRADPGIENARTLTALSNLGVMRLRAGDLRAADAHLTEAVTVRRRVLGEDHPDVGVSLRWRSELRRAQGRVGDAEADGRAALAIFEATLPPGHPRIVEASLCVGAALVESGRPAAALPLLRGVLDARADADPADLGLAEARAWLGRALVQAGKRPEGRALLRDALTAYDAAGRADEPAARMARAALSG